MADAPSFSVDSRARRLTQRGVDAREKILDATIKCIVRSGVTATTIEHVMAEAQLSRGSVLHQFPNRVALMVATAERAMRRVMDSAGVMAAEIEDPFERLSDYARISWETHSAPEGLALTDILLAARWDAELIAGLQPVASQVEQEIHDEFIKLASEAGFDDAEVLVPHGWLLIASVRGLIIEHSLGYERPMIIAAIDRMMERHRRFCINLAARDREENKNSQI
ncbi:hypothetical protein ASD67_11500 [Sphingopyxis sp. Root1497]|jgi:AcrR family transcriptional regulator|uniref:TetR/AcrR family transcriptional regulator n=1 Tax=Sphingopyxis sp. Root1497 TaxID=1736474 RepID=UPI000700CE1B|nr:TetR/AcrR family transcriptional regulator [Sphingopyxis sp. Root1497]KQZ65013.1 hypothetical protein ASD67_11500 [Sphingopyxis sp. Root1497]